MRERAKKIWRRFGLSSLVLLALVLLAAIGVLVYLQSERGANELRARLLAEANRLLSGSLSVRDLDLRFGGRVVLHDVELRDPEGRLVARVGRLEAEVDPGKLLRKNVHVESLELTDAELHLVDAPEGLNLVRAVEPKVKGPESTAPPGPFDWTIRADELLVEKLAFDFRSGGYETEALFAAEVARLDADGGLGPGGTRIRAELAGALQVPIARPFSISGVLEGGGRGNPLDPLRLEPLKVDAGASKLVARATRRADRFTVALEQLHVTSEELNALIGAETPVFVQTLDAKGQGTLEGMSATAELTVSLPRGRIALDGSAQLDAAARSARARARLEAVDASSVLAQAPPTKVNGSIEARLDLREPLPGDGAFTLELNGSELRGQPFSTLTARGRTRGLEAQLESLVAEIAGARASVKGSASPDRLDLQGEISAGNLARAIGAITRMVGVEQPPIAGSGQVSATLKGPPRAPTLAVIAHFATLEAAALRLRTLSVTGSIPDLTRPLALNADVRAAEGAAGSLTFHELLAALDVEGRDIAGTLTTSGMLGGELRLRGLLDPDQLGAKLSELAAVMGATAWQLQQPAALRWEGGFRVDRAELASGDQRVVASGGITGERLDVKLRAERLNLGELPKQLLPETLTLEGRVGADAVLGGTVNRPRGSGTFSLEGAGVNALREIDGSGKVLLSPTRIEGSAALTRNGSKLDARADLPLKLLGAPKNASVSATVEVVEAPLTDVAQLLELPELTAGLASVRAELSGTVGDPVVVAQVHGKGVRFGAFPVAELELAARAEQAVVVDAELDTPNGDLLLEASAPLSLSSVLREPPTAESLLQLPLRAKLEAKRVLIAAFAEPLKLPTGTAGVLDVTAELAGTARVPRGIARVRVDEGTFGEWKAIRGDVGVTLAEDRVASSGRIGLGGERAAEFVATVDAAPEKLIAGQSLGTTPVSLHSTFGPLPLAALAPADRDVLQARIEGALELGGTLAAPLAKARILAADVTSEDRRLGDVATRVEYRGGSLETDTVATLTTGGSARIDADAKVDLGLDALRKGIDTAAIPLQARAQASALNLALLDLLPGIRRAGGQLAMDATIDGTLGSPRPRGTVAVKDGRVTVEGVGSYRDIQLAASATDLLVAIEKLSLRSGRGTVEASARAERSALGEPYRLAAKLVANAFPIPVKDQVAGYVTGESSSITGSIGTEALDLDVRLRKAEMTLPERVPKDLQGLEQHPDVVVVKERGVSTEAAERERAAESKPYRLRLRVQAPRNLWVKSSDIVVEAGADVTAQVTGSDVDLSGQVEVKRARVDALGRKFEIDPVDPKLQNTHARLTFTGAAPQDARIEVLAAHENQREQVVVNVGVTGTLRKPKIALTSEPPLEEAQIVTLLAAGRLELKRGTGAVSTGSTAATALTALIADRLRKTVAAQLPSAFMPDVLQVEIGQTTQVEAGMYLTDRLYLGYQHDFGARLDRGENLNEVRLEYQLTPRTTVEAFGGDAGSAAGELVWTRDY